MGTPSLSFGTVAVLHAVAAGHRFGFDIVDATGLTAGSVYPALDRLEELGLLRSSWESTAAATAGKRPARRYFALTGDGARALAEVLRKHRTFHPVSLEAFGLDGLHPQRRKA
ncbi:MAG TPA: helix-turn-helix transcriptional regulator [Vicinamibacterales bacterium]|nr:helix-turn-helix transcriptional regulator [Vicinamibacterales bacterium]